MGRGSDWPPKEKGAVGGAPSSFRMGAEVRVLRPIRALETALAGAKWGPNMLLQGIHVLFELALPVGGFVLVDDAFGGQTVQVALHVVEEFFGFFLVV